MGLHTRHSLCLIHREREILGASTLLEDVPVRKAIMKSHQTINLLYLYHRKSTILGIRQINVIPPCLGTNWPWKRTLELRTYMSAFTSRASPKSEILHTLFSPTRMLRAAKSRWTTCNQKWSVTREYPRTYLLTNLSIQSMVILEAANFCIIVDIHHDTVTKVTMVDDSERYARETSPI